MDLVRTPDPPDPGEPQNSQKCQAADDPSTNPSPNVTIKDPTIAT